MPNEIEHRRQEPGANNRKALFRWEPQPLQIPEVDPGIAELPALKRAAEVVRYTVHRIEYWVSPHGFLREYLRLNLLVAAIVAVTGVVVAPFITLLLGEILTWINLILQILTGIGTIALAAVAVFILVRVIRAMRK